jgi:threonine dehydrogenase-like Zn-dependent dehydrogenase
MKILIVGGGWSGCAAAIEAKKQGAEVTLLERTDMILGTGLVGGIMRNNGRYTATEEMIAMGGGELFQVIETTLTHKCIKFPGHEHADLYDIARTPIAVINYLNEHDIDVRLKCRISKAVMCGSNIKSIEDDKGNVYSADLFIDTTGTAGPMSNCIKYGNGCAMCVLRCPSFGGRISLAGLTGTKEIVGKKDDGLIGAMSGSCKLCKESLSDELIYKLNTEGVAVVPLPEELIENHLSIKACQQYALKEFAENIILLDTGHAKLMTPYYPLEKLHKIPGFENARYEDPYSGSKGNSMRFFAMCNRDNSLKVQDLGNLFCAGEKAGLLVGHTEAIVTGVLAGYNAVQSYLNKPLLVLPESLAIGDAIAFVKEEMKTPKGLGKKYTFSGSVLFDHMKEKGLYLTDNSEINNKVEHLGLKNIFA